MRLPPILLLAGAVFGSPAMSAEDAKPISLGVHTETDHVDLTVMGDADSREEAVFELEFSGHGQGGTTKTRQSGRSSPGGPAGTLLRSRVSTSGLKSWDARLHVKIGGREYVILRNS